MRGEGRGVKLIAPTLTLTLILSLTGGEVGAANGLNHEARLTCGSELTALRPHARREYPDGRRRLAHVGDRRDIRRAHYEADVSVDVPGLLRDLSVKG